MHTKIGVAIVAGSLPELFAGFSYLGGGRLRANWSQPQPLDGGGVPFALYGSAEDARQAREDVATLDRTRVPRLVEVVVREVV